jgi:hypothetical protein
MAALQERLQKFCLKLHPEKTRRIEFGRASAARREREGRGRCETCDFLGFTHIGGRTRKNQRLVLWRRTSAKRLRSHTGGDQRATDPSPTRHSRYDRTLAGHGHSGLAAISCRAEQHESAGTIRDRTHQALATSTAPTQSTRPCRLVMVPHDTSCRSLPTEVKDPTSVSERPLSRSTSGKSRTREYFTYGSVRGAAGNGCPYRAPEWQKDQRVGLRSLGTAPLR